MIFFLIPFWVTIALLLRFLFNTYTSILLASLLFGAVEIMKARKSDEFVWKSLRQDINVIGHRACAINAPENTLAGVREAVRLGVKAVEIDITLTADNEPIIIHDSTVDRTTDGTGIVSSMTWADIQKLDASAKFQGSGSFSREKVPHLREMLAECKKHGLRVFLDMKGSRPITMAKALKAMVEEFPDLHEWAVVCSFYPHLLYAVKWSLPQFVTILTHRPWVITHKDTNGETRNHELWKKIAAPIADVLLELSNNYFLWDFCGVNAVFMEQETVSVSNVKYWNARGVDVVVWTVNNPNVKKYLRSMSLPYITDDCTMLP